MFESITVIGSGRVGSAVSARLRERGIALADEGELVLLCVPDAVIFQVTPLSATVGVALNWTVRSSRTLPGDVMVRYRSSAALVG